jgi:hypothetical protein
MNEFLRIAEANGHTGGSLTSGGSAREITSPLTLILPLEIAVYSIVAVILYSVRLVAGTTLKDRATVSSSSTSIIQRLLKGLITQPIFAEAVSSTYGRKKKLI